MLVVVTYDVNTENIRWQKASTFSGKKLHEIWATRAK